MSCLAAQHGLVCVTLYMHHELHNADLNDKGLVGNCASVTVLQ